MNRPVKADTSSETIKDRIDRETKEQMEAGSAKQRALRPGETDIAEAIAREAAKPPSQQAVLTSKYVTEGVHPEQAHWRAHFEISVFPKVGVDDIEEFLTLCLLRGFPVLGYNREDYVWLHVNRQEQMQGYNRDENLRLLEQHYSAQNAVPHPDPEYTRGFNDGKNAFNASLITVPINAAKMAGAPLPGPWTAKALEDITSVLGARGHSYAADYDEFQNFAEQAALGDQTMRQVFRGALGQKLARERATWARLDELGDVEFADSEAYLAMKAQWIDSIRDICGYALLMFGWAKRVEELGE